ncbi:hypothetical protein F7P69_05480 [Cellulosimicrobium funkei]|nr:hypothetical protein [Cellulosimicrobium funkei]
MPATPDHGPGSGVSTDVLIVGAGPTGLMAGAARWAPCGWTDWGNR